VAVLTVARVAPKNTMLLAIVVLKLVPVRVTTSPGLALKGLKEFITGCAKVVKAQLNNIINSSKSV
jgi:hypothetical protein